MGSGTLNLLYGFSFIPNYIFLNLCFIKRFDDSNCKFWRGWGASRPVCCGQFQGGAAVAMWWRADHSDGMTRYDPGAASPAPPHLPSGADPSSGQRDRAPPMPVALAGAPEGDLSPH